MKIGLNQPNGFTTHFAQDPSKYLDNNNESKSNSNFYIQTLNIEKINSIPTLIMEVQLLPLQVKILSLSEVIPDFLKVMVLLPEIKLNLSK